MGIINSRTVGISVLLGGGLLVAWTNPAEAQIFGRRRDRIVASEAIVSPPVVSAPGPVVIEPSRVKVKRRKVVVRERRGVVARVPAVVTETRVVPPPPAVERRVIETPPVVEDRVAPSRPAGGEPPLRLEPQAESGFDPLPG